MSAIISMSLKEAGAGSNQNSAYEEHGKGADQKSVWYHFLREVTGKSAKCKKCPKIIKTMGGSTSGLHTHLRTAHNINLLKSNVEEGGARSQAEGSGCNKDKKKNNILNNFGQKKDDSLDAVLSRMTACDGLPFSVFGTSQDMRDLLKAKGLTELPTSPNTVRRKVMDYSKRIGSFVISEIADRKKEGQRFSLSFDEWTSTRNRYLNINVHDSGSKFWSIGFVRIYGNMPTEKCVELITLKLEAHGISLTEVIVCICTDGASVMVKVGRLMETEQLCFAHGTQLAVIDALYKKTDSDSSHTDSDTSTANVEVAVRTNSDSEEHGLGSDLDEIEHADGFVELQLEDDDDEQFRNTNNELCHNDLSPLISKVRKVVAIFRKSPTKNDDVLQKYVSEEFNKKLTLVSDSKTRWSSMLSMLERFLKLRYCAQKALIDLKSSVVFTEAEFDLIGETVAALEPVKITVEALYCGDANLLTAETALLFMMNSLKDQGSDLSTEIYEALKFRIGQRRTILSGVLQYLHNPTPSSENPLDLDTLFSIPPPYVICRTVKTLLECLSGSPSSTNSSCHNETSQSEAEPVPCEREDMNKTLSLKEKLELAIKKKLTAVNSPQPQEKNTIIKKEMSLFEGGGSRGVHLQLAYNNLMTIKPTSVESERAFSSSGLLCNKIRSRLNDVSLDELCFLRSYFKSQKI